MLEVKITDLISAFNEIYTRGESVSLVKAWTMITGVDHSNKDFAPVNRWILAKFLGWRYYARAVVQPYDFLDSMQPPLWRAIARMSRDEDSVVLACREYSGIPPNNTVHELYVHTLKTIQMRQGDVIIPNPK